MRRSCKPSAISIVAASLSNYSALTQCLANDSFCRACGPHGFGVQMLCSCRQPSRVVLWLKQQMHNTRLIALAKFIYYSFMP